LAPGYDVGDLSCSLNRASELRFFRKRIGEFVRFGFDKTFEKFDFCCLGVSVVHHFIEKLINNHKIISDGFLLNILEITFQDIDEGMQKGEDQNCIIIFLRNGNEVKVIVLVEIKQIIVLVFDKRSM
jgi:hypothetical protein